MEKAPSLRKKVLLKLKKMFLLLKLRCKALLKLQIIIKNSTNKKIYQLSKNLKANSNQKNLLEQEVLKN